MSKNIAQRSFALPSVEENARILAAAKADPNAQPLTDAQLKAMIPLKSVRAKPKSDKKA